MATFTERVTRNGERRWRAEVRRDGFPAARATFTTRREAERWARTREGEIASARHLPDLEAERRTVGELLDRWGSDLTAKRLKAVRAHLAHWRAEIGHKRLAEVTAALLREKRDMLARTPFTRSVPRKEVTLTPRRTPDGEPRLFRRSPATANRYFETLATALEVGAREYEWLQVNPARKVADLREPQGRVRFLSDAERGALLAACEAESADLHALVVLALCTGARAGELLRLRWSDIDFARRRALVHESKNTDRRALALTGPAERMLRERSKVRRIDTDLVFPDPVNARDGSPRPLDYAKRFGKARRAAGLADFRFHDLRHTAASWLAMCGATTTEIGAVLGHRTLAMVRRYSHLADTHVASVVERMTTNVFGR